jgi:VIT1/CCC1 family predicted Fe2+/Mn2+ transporter
MPVLLADAGGGARSPFTPGKWKSLTLSSALCLAVLVATFSVYARYPGRALFSLTARDFVRVWIGS